MDVVRKEERKVEKEFDPAQANGLVRFCETPREYAYLYCVKMIFEFDAFIRAPEVDLSARFWSIFTLQTFYTGRTK